MSLKAIYVRICQTLSKNAVYAEKLFTEYVEPIIFYLTWQCSILGTFSAFQALKYFDVEGKHQKKCACGKVLQFPKMCESLHIYNSRDY